MEHSKLEMGKISLHKWLKNFVTIVKKMAKEENFHKSIVFRVITRFRKEFSIEWEEQKNRRSRTRDKTMDKKYASPTSKIHVYRNVM